MIRRQRFPISLVFPPQGHFTQPYLALPCLKAHLVANGFADTELIDASVEAYDRFLSAEYLERQADRAALSLSLAGYAQRVELPFENLERFRAAAETAVSARAVIEGVEDAKRVVRGEAAFEPDRYVPAIRTLYHGLRLVSAAHFPTVLTPHNFTMASSNDRSREVLEAVRDAERNPFVEHFETQLLPRLAERRPRLVGLSVIYGSQLIPALTLGRLIKRSLPDCHVTTGGGFLAYIGEKLMAVPEFAECLDSIVFHEGETPILELARALEGGGDLHEVGSLTWFDSSAGAARAVKNAPRHPLKLDDAPAPDFDGLPFDLYFSPETVVPYDINRGCYYGECTFCTLPTVIGPGYRTRSAERIVDHVLELTRRHGTRNVNFVTDCMPPGMIRDLPDELIRRGADIRWWSDARVEPRAYDADGARRLYESGCRKLLFGFETATPRLLKLMQKGQSLRSTAQVAKNCAEAGISVTFYAMVGFPSETREEARATLDFLIEHKDAVREVSLQTFHVDEVAQTYKDPERFGLRFKNDPGADLALYHDYEADSGMTQTEAAEAFAEMMAGLREHYPLFSGDTFFYFMQKSHYFLHLARGEKPETFIARARAREERRAAPAGLDGLSVRPGVRFVDVPFSYAEAVRTLGHPLAKAVRPEFLTGRYVEGAREQARAELPPLEPTPRVLAYAPGGHGEWVELRPDGRDLLRAIERAGSVGGFRQAHAIPEGRAARSFERFVTTLHRLGMFVTTTRTPVTPTI